MYFDDMDDDLLAARQAALDETARRLEKLTERAARDHWPADDRAALADQRDDVADAVDAVASSFDHLADRRDQDAILRQRASRVRTEIAIQANPALEPGLYLRYKAARDRDSADADRDASAADRTRAAGARIVAATARQHAADDREEAVVDRAFADAAANGNEQSDPRPAATNLDSRRFDTTPTDPTASTADVQAQAGGE